MLIRVVRLVFREDELARFDQFFDEHRDSIQSQSGCSKVELLMDPIDVRVRYTLSYWKDETYLEAYRKSDLFKTIWPEVKKWFDEKPQAWSLKKSG